MKKQGLGLKIFTYVFLTVMALIVILPFYWMVNTALKTYSESTALSQTFLPSFQWANFYSAWVVGNIGQYVANTIFVAVVSTFFTVIVTILSAFAFAKLEFKGNGLVFGVFLATMMIPGEMMVITNYITVANLGWMNSYQALIVPFIASVFYIYLLRNNFKQIPNELHLAAKVDGLSDFKYLRKVMIPLAKPTIFSIIILKVIATWNSYVWPNIVTDINHKDLMMITNGIKNAFTPSDGLPQVHLQMAAAVIVTLPLLILFLCFKNYIIKGVSRSGIKG